MNTDEIISELSKEIDKKRKYTASVFFDWHGRLTGSCKQGREHFIKQNNIKLDDEMNMQEFLQLCSKDGLYGSDIINQIK